MSQTCIKCNSQDNVEEHHISYVPEETVMLCHSCHKRVHSNPQSEYHPKQKLEDVEGLEREDAPERASLTVKQINSNKYVYWQWRDGEQIQSEYIGSMSKLFENITAWGSAE